MDSIIGRTILGYTVKEKIGTGAFGKVYRVQRSNIVGNVTRALKVITLPKENQYIDILNSMGGDIKKAEEYFKNELNRVLDEIRVFSMISEKDNHNIVSYYENEVEKDGECKYNIYILMEELMPLDKWLHQNNLTVEQGIDIGLGIAKALKICHENNIIHRDIKVNNVFVTKDGKFKLGDFGVSKRLDTMTHEWTIKGTPHYIAPDIYIGNNKYNNSVDIYSLGILMYYLFNKQRFPFYPDFPNKYSKEDEDKAFYKRMQYDELKAPVCASDELANIIKKAVASPSERYTNADDLIADLEKVKNSLSLEELNTPIGFEPVKKNELTVGESKVVEKLQSERSGSISFEEHSIETISKKRAASWKKIVIAAVLLLLLTTFLAAGYFVKNPDTKKKLIVESQTEEVNTTKELEKTTKEETATKETTKAETTRKPEKTTEKPTEVVTTKVEAEVTTKSIAVTQQKGLGTSKSEDSKNNDSNDEFKFDNIFE